MRRSAGGDSDLYSAGTTEMDDYILAEIFSEAVPIPRRNADNLEIDE
jgi:hypothetical protein